MNRIGSVLRGGDSTSEFEVRQPDRAAR